MKIIQINDCDWWIGESLEACKADYIATTGDPDSVEDDAHELTDSELDRLMFVECAEDERTISDKRPFRDQLAIEVAKGGEFPRMFASTEF